jgi:hypothetical protein
LRFAKKVNDERSDSYLGITTLPITAVNSKGLEQTHCVRMDNNSTSDVIFAKDPVKKITDCKGSKKYPLAEFINPPEDMKLNDKKVFEDSIEILSSYIERNMRHTMTALNEMKEKTLSEKMTKLLKESGNLCNPVFPNERSIFVNQFFTKAKE